MPNTRMYENEIAKKAEKISRALAKERVNENEVAKIISILKAKVDSNPENALSSLNELLERFASTEHFSRSNKTKGYYRSFRAVIRNFSFNDAKEALITLGWARRLLRYIENKR